MSFELFIIFLLLFIIIAAVVIGIALLKIAAVVLVVLGVLVLIEQFCELAKKRPTVAIKIAILAVAVISAFAGFAVIKSYNNNNRPVQIFEITSHCSILIRGSTEIFSEGAIVAIYEVEDEPDKSKLLFTIDHGYESTTVEMSVDEVKDSLCLSEEYIELTYSEFKDLDNWWTIWWNSDELKETSEE